MSDFRKAAQDVVSVWKMYGTAESLRGWMEILEAALAQEQAEPVQEPVRCPASYMCDCQEAGQPCARAAPKLEQGQAEPSSDFDRGFQRGWRRAMRDRDRDFAMRAGVEEKLAALVQEQAPLGAWQPIETAPRDGTWVLLAGGYCDDEDVDDNASRVVSGQWTNYLNGRIKDLFGRWQFAWYDGGYFGEYLSPTHWMPMPGPAEPTIPLFVGRRSALEKDK